MRLIPPKCSSGGRCRIRKGKFTLYAVRNAKQQGKLPVTVRKCVKCGKAYGKVKVPRRHAR